ncbi:MAG: A/G-specific adenine glycosylase [Roseburia sp.]|nr:A/G-specific adenine glycosylase [Roseburia sp.]
MIKDYKLEQLIDPLLEWFAGNARVLPWRSEPTPYRVWVSEIMLQQTRVEAVKPYFQRFIKALPDVQALADCPEDKLLKLWEGLGYYNRVRNMQKAAIQVREEYDGMIPADYEALLKLKGIGHYTAGAIASIAYGIPVPAVDGNVLRVLTRVTADDTDIMKQSFRTEVEEALTRVMQQESENGQNKMTGGQKNLAGAFNQALMELGATVCLPNGAPLCEKCPWQEVCRARQEDLIDQLPVKSKAKARKIEKRTVLIIRDDDKVAIRKRPARGLLAGLYELPNVEGELSAEQALSLVKEMHFVPIRIQELTEAKHIFSHIEWHMKGYAIRVEESGLSETARLADETVSDENPQSENESANANMMQTGQSKIPELIFVDAEDARERYAIPSAFAAYAEYMNIQLGKERFSVTVQNSPMHLLHSTPTGVSAV